MRYPACMLAAAAALVLLAAQPAGGKSERKSLRTKVVKLEREVHSLHKGLEKLRSDHVRLVEAFRAWQEEARATPLHSAR